MEKGKSIYWAGFFDGQGHIELGYRKPTYANRYGAYIFQIWIDQWTKNPLDFYADLIKTFGGKLIKHKKRSDSVRWYISGEKARSFLEALLPYLRGNKRAAELGIALHKRMHTNGTLLDEAECQARDMILEEYYSLVQDSEPKKRIRSFGQHNRFGQE